MTRRGWMLFVALGVIWGLPYLLIKVAVQDLAPASLVFLRTGLGALILLPLALTRGGLARLRPHLGWVILFSVTEMVIPWFLLADVERRVSSSLAGLVVASVPIVGAMFSRLWGGGEPLGGRRMVGLGVGLAGVAALLGLDLGGGDPLALLELAVIVAGYAFAPLLVSRKLSDVPPLDVVTASLAVCALLHAPLGIAQLPAELPGWPAVSAVVSLSIFCTALAFLLFFALIAEVGPVRATVITYVNPAVAVLAGVAVLGEAFTPGTALGFVLILAGSWLATSRAAPGRRPERAPGLAEPAV